MIGAVVGIVLLAILIWIVMELLVQVMDDYSMTIHLLTFHKTKNKLYQCNKCRKLSREYQQKLYKGVNGRLGCPHCESFQYFSRDEIHETEKWMDKHPDCPKINFFQHLKIKRTIEQIKANQKAIESQKFFEEYNKIEVDFSWIENLQKKYK